MKVALPVSILLLASACPPLAWAGNVFVVDAAGGPFTQIQPAVLAAQNGDVVLVKTGAYPSFSISDKALAIVGDTGSDVQISGAVHVSNLAPGKTVVLANLNASGIQAVIPTSTHGLVLANNQGHVRAEGCTFAGFVDPSACCSADCSAAASCHAGVRSDATADLSLAACTITGGTAAAIGNGSQDPAGAGGPGIDARHSTLVLHDSIVRGGAGKNGGTCGGEGGPGGGGSLLTQSALLAANSVFDGGDGGDVYAGICLGGNSFGGRGGDGIAASSSSAHLLDTDEHGGVGGTILVGGCGTCARVGSNGLARSGTGFIDVPGAARVLVAPTPVREQTSPAFTFVGPPGERVGLLLATTAASPEYISTWHGFRLVPVSQPPLVLHVGWIPPSGSLTVNLATPTLAPGEQARVRYIQALFVDSQRRKHLGTPSSMVVLDSLF